jgi:hypothetical protein
VSQLGEQWSAQEGRCDATRGSGDHRKVGDIVASEAQDMKLVEWDRDMYDIGMIEPVFMEKVREWYEPMEIDGIIIEVFGKPNYPYMATKLVESVGPNAKLYWRKVY